MGAEQTTLLDSEGAHGDVGFDFLVSQMETELEPERKDASERAARTIQFHVRRRSMQIRKEAARIEKEEEEAVAGVADREDAGGSTETPSLSLQPRVRTDSDFIAAKEEGQDQLERFEEKRTPTRPVILQQQETEGTPLSPTDVLEEIVAYQRSPGLESTKTDEPTKESKSNETRHGLNLMDATKNCDRRQHPDESSVLLPAEISPKKNVETTVETTSATTTPARKYSSMAATKAQLRPLRVAGTQTEPTKYAATTQRVHNAQLYDDIISSLEAELANAKQEIQRLRADRDKRTSSLSETMAKLAKRLLAEHKNLKVEHDAAVVRADMAEESLLEGQAHATELSTENEMLTRKESELHMRAKAAETSLVRAAEVIESRDRTIANLRDQLSLAQRQRDEANEDAASAAQVEIDQLRAELSGALEMLRVRELRESPQHARQDETIRSIAAFPEIHHHRDSIEEWAARASPVRIDQRASMATYPVSPPQRKWTLPVQPAPGLSVSMEHRYSELQQHGQRQIAGHHYSSPSLPNLSVAQSPGKKSSGAKKSSGTKKNHGGKKNRTTMGNKKASYAKTRFDLFG